MLCNSHPFPDIFKEHNDCLIINVTGAVDRNNEGVFKLTKKQIFVSKKNSCN